MPSGKNREPGSFNMRSVVEVDIRTRRRLNTWDNSYDAAEATGMTRQSIVDTCRSHKVSLNKRRYFRFEDDFDPYEVLPDYRHLPVYVTDGKRLTVYDTLKDLAKALKVPVSTLSANMPIGTYNGLEIGRLRKGVKETAEEVAERGVRT